jgi:hypothetical protein
LPRIFPIPHKITSILVKKAGTIRITDCVLTKKYAVMYCNEVKKCKETVSAM